MKSAKINKYILVLFLSPLPLLGQGLSEYSLAQNTKFFLSAKAKNSIASCNSSKRWPLKTISVNQFTQTSLTKEVPILINKSKFGTVELIKYLFLIIKTTRLSATEWINNHFSSI